MVECICDLSFKKYASYYISNSLKCSRYYIVFRTFLPGAPGTDALIEEDSVDDVLTLFGPDLAFEELGEHLQFEEGLEERALVIARFLDVLAVAELLLQVLLRVHLQVPLVVLEHTHHELEERLPYAVHVFLRQPLLLLLFRLDDVLECGPQFLRLVFRQLRQVLLLRRLEPPVRSQRH